MHITPAMDAIYNLAISLVQERSQRKTVRALGVYLKSRPAAANLSNFQVARPVRFWRKETRLFRAPSRADRVLRRSGLGIVGP